jgi:hypothetical protein
MVILHVIPTEQNYNNRGWCCIARRQRSLGCCPQVLCSSQVAVGVLDQHRQGLHARAPTGFFTLPRRYSTLAPKQVPRPQDRTVQVGAISGTMVWHPRASGFTVNRTLMNFLLLQFVALCKSNNNNSFELSAKCHAYDQ